MCAIIKNKPQKKDEQFQLDVDTNDWVLLKTKYKNLSIKFTSKNGGLIKRVNNNLFVCYGIKSTKVVILYPQKF